MVMQRSIWVAFALASIGWGSGSPVARLLLDRGLSPYELVLFRSAIAALAIVVYLAVRSQLRAGRIAVTVGLVMAFTSLALPFVLSTIALQYASAGFVALPGALIPLMTAGMAHFLLPGDRISPAKVIGMTLGLAGVIILLTSGDSGLVAGGRPGLAGALGLASAFSIAAGSVYAKQHVDGYATLEVAGVQFVAGAAMILAATLVAEGGPAVPDGGSWLLLLYMGLVSTFVPFVAYYWLLRRISASFASTIGYIVPLIAVVAGIVLVDELLQTGIVVGGALILLGVAVTDRLEARVKSRAASRPGA